MKKTLKIIEYVAYNISLYALAWLAADAQIAGAKYLIGFASLLGWVAFLASFSNEMCRVVRARPLAVPLKFDHCITAGLVCFLVWHGFFLTAAGFFFGAIGSDALRTRKLPVEL